MGSSYTSLLRKRVYANLLPFLPTPMTYKWVEFHEVKMEHIFSRWDYGGDAYLYIILVDEQGTKIEATACGNHHMLFDSVLIEGETYDFLGVCFAPTYVDPIRRHCLTRKNSKRTAG
uniref:DUF223 domain-containing protein n=1 Tax=Setaria viridis TaxID=4556 RepID=A0A4U6TMD3_SETVI|nr:hypothetical protein SEVIR_7G062500v2 [Setaria viridis]